MKYPYDYEVEENNNGLITAGVIVGVLAAGSIAFALLKRKNDKGEPDMKNNAYGSSNIEIVDNSNKPAGKEFFMPHFMLKKFTVKPDQSGLKVNVDYVTDDLLNQYILKSQPKYSYRLTLPAAYKDMFEHNGTQTIEGNTLDNGKKKSNTATFEFVRKKDIAGKAIDMMNEDTGKYKFEIIDDKNNIVNAFDDIKGATNIIRF